MAKEQSAADKQLAWDLQRMENQRRADIARMQREAQQKNGK